MSASSPSCWLALVAEPPQGVWACAAVASVGVGAPATSSAGGGSGADGGDEGGVHAGVGDEALVAVGFLAVWRAEDAPVEGALRADPGAFDASGAAAWVSLVLPPEAMRPAFDDLAVQQARRALLAGPPPAAITTLLADDSHFAGSLTARRGQDAPALLHDDPFGRVLPARILHCAAGLLADRPPPPGPTIERHGSAVPWPGGRI